MRRALALVLALAVAGSAGAAYAQGERESTRLYPKSGNPDGTLNCAPSCDMLGPCC